MNVALQCPLTYGEDRCKLPVDHVGLHQTHTGTCWYGTVRFPADRRFRW